MIDTTIQYLGILGGSVFAGFMVATALRAILHWIAIFGGIMILFIGALAYSHIAVINWDIVKTDLHIAGIDGYHLLSGILSQVNKGLGINIATSGTVLTGSLIGLGIGAFRR